MLTPSTLTIPQGGVGSTRVDTSLVSGVPQHLQLTVANLPQQAAASFAPPSVLTGVEALLSISVGALTPGSYDVFVKAAGPYASHQATLTLVVTASDFSV